MRAVPCLLRALQHMGAASALCVQALPGQAPVYLLLPALGPRRFKRGYKNVINKGIELNEQARSVNLRVLVLGLKP